MNKRTLIMLCALGVAAAALIASQFLDTSGISSPPKVATPPKAPAAVTARPAQQPAAEGPGESRPAATDARRIAYVYDVQAQRDPFAPLVLPKVEKAREERQRGPAVIGSYELAEVRLIGIVSQGGEAYGVLQTPDGRSYTVREGLRLGEAGMVHRVDANSLTIRETFKDSKGSIKVKDTTLRLRKGEG